MSLPKFLTAALAVAAMAAPASASIIADLDGDYSTGQVGYSFLWNPTSASIGTAAGYVALSSVNDDFLEQSADPSDNFTNSINNSSVANSRLGIYDNTFAPAPPQVYDTVSTIQGGKDVASSTDGLAHYGIVGYTVQAGEAGDNGLFTFSGTSSGNGAGSELLVFVNDTQVGANTATSGLLDFTANLGTLGVGDTVYLAGRGLDSSNSRNTQRIFSQFTIEADLSAVPEPSSAALLGLGIAGLIARRRR